MAAKKLYKIQWKRGTEIIDGKEVEYPTYTSDNAWTKEKAESLLALAHAKFEAAEHWLIPVVRRPRGRARK